MQHRLPTRAAGIVVALLLGGLPACSGADKGGATFCDRVGSLPFDELGRSGINVAKFRAARDALAGLHPPAELQADVRVLVALYDLVIDRFGGIDLVHPDAKELAAVASAQQELEAQLIANEGSLTRIRDAVAACPTTSTTSGS
jgi:hypothetical protein